MRGTLLVSLLVFGGLAGCTGPAPEEPVMAVPEPPVPEAEAVDWSATLGSYTCVQNGGVSFCGFSGPAVTNPTLSADTQPVYLHEADGRDLAGGNLTMEWQAATPTTEALRLVVAAWTGCGDEEDDCEELATLASATGLSPLSVAVPAKSFGRDVDEDDDVSIVVRVEPVNFAQGAKMSLGQPFVVTGDLEFIEPMPEWSIGDDEDEDEEDDEDDG